MTGSKHHLKQSIKYVFKLKNGLSFIKIDVETSAEPIHLLINNFYLNEEILEAKNTSYQKLSKYVTLNLGLWNTNCANPRLVLNAKTKTFYWI